jgi:hypothetical protein
MRIMSERDLFPDPKVYGTELEEGHDGLGRSPPFSILGMTNKPGSTKPWKTAHFALYGAVIGLLVGIVHSYTHAFWSHALEDDLHTHVRNYMIGSIMTGAAILGAVSVIRNWLVRRL